MLEFSAKPRAQKKLFISIVKGNNHDLKVEFLGYEELVSNTCANISLAKVLEYNKVGL